MIRLAASAGPASAAPAAAVPATPAAMPVERWGAWDLLMAGTLASLCYSIVELPGIPVTPSVWLPLLFIFVSRHEVRRRGRALLRHPVFALTYVLLGALVCVRAVLIESTFAAIADAARVMGAVGALGALVLYASSSPGRFRRAAMTLMVLMAASLAWFLLELTVVQPFVRLRLMLYADIYAQDRTGFVERLRSGLVPYLHLLGYQVAAFVPLALVPLLERRRRPAGLVFGGMGVLLAILVLFISGQRSALAAVVLSLGMVLFYTGGPRLALRVSLLAVVVVLAADTLLRRDMWTGAGAGENRLFEKLVSEESYRDAEFRMRMQARGMQLIVQNPLGLQAARLSWVQEGFMHVHARMEQAPRYAVGAIAVHNGYLGTAIEYGLAFLLLSGALLVALWRTSLRLVRQRDVLPPGLRLWTVGVAAAIGGLFGFQAFTHNASLLTLEPVTTLSLGLLLALDLLRKAAIRAQSPPPAPAFMPNRFLR